MSNPELHLCDGCWDRRWDAISEHGCEYRVRPCDCPCTERTSDLDTIDLYHDRGFYRDIWSGHIERC